MFHTLDSLRGLKIRAQDGDVGSIEDFLFDDSTWTIRYFVVDTGPWLFGREVLISPQAVGQMQAEDDFLPVNLTKEQVKNSPEVDLDQPISRQMEEAMQAHYGWQNYWMSLPLGTNAGAVTTPPPGAPAETPDDTVVNAPGDPHLRSVDEVVGYDIVARGGDVGRVDDFMVDDADWTIRYMVVDTSNWLTGKEVLIAPEWVEHFDWESAEVTVSLTRQQIKDSPGYEPAALSRDYEKQLHDHYGMRRYWG